MNRFFLSIVSLLVSLSMSGALAVSKVRSKRGNEESGRLADCTPERCKTRTARLTNAALYMGMLDWAELAEKESGDTSYYDWHGKVGTALWLATLRSGVSR